jgi:IS30 family transposase
MTTRKQRKSVTTESVKEFQRLRKEGFNNQQIAELTNYSAPTVGRHLKNAKPAGKQLTEDQRKSIVTQRNAGMPFSAIALNLHCSESTAHRIFHEETGRYNRRYKRGQPVLAEGVAARKAPHKAPSVAREQSTTPWGALAALVVLAGIAALAI